MPRPVKFRQVGFEPNVNYFKPVGVPMATLEEVVLTVEEFEAVRLKDVEGLEQVEAAERMGISQPTFNRLLNSARSKIADAIVSGKAIRIEGGNYQFVGRGMGYGRGGAGRGFGRGRGGRF
jgi:predicted DNA-binding protein (UPF0251 family)